MAESMERHMPAHIPVSMAGICDSCAPSQIPTTVPHTKASAIPPAMPVSIAGNIAQPGWKTAAPRTPLSAPKARFERKSPAMKAVDITR
jgi:hypothetical protein